MYKRQPYTVDYAVDGCSLDVTWDATWLHDLSVSADKFTLQADANPVLSTILYTIMVVCTIAFNTWFGAYLGTIVTNHHWDSVFITLLTKLLVMTVPTLWTYPLNRFVIHRKKKAKVEPLPESADTPAGAAA